MARVLIVEDERQLRRIIALHLARRGYSVAEADTVAEANDVLAEWGNAFDVILLDVNLPDKTGWDVLRKLARNHRVAGEGGQRAGTMPKVIIISAVRPVQSRIEECHPDAVLVKPFPMQALLQLIERVVASEPAEVEAGEAGEVDDHDGLISADDRGAERAGHHTTDPVEREGR